VRRESVVDSGRDFEFARDVAARGLQFLWSCGAWFQDLHESADGSTLGFNLHLEHLGEWADVEAPTFHRHAWTREMSEALGAQAVEDRVEVYG
jgi:hypothetical protein